MALRRLRNLLRRHCVRGNPRMSFLALTVFGVLAFVAMFAFLSRDQGVSLATERLSHLVRSGHVMCIKPSGGLGNNLFQFAGAYGIARHVGLEVVLEPSNPVFQFFDVEVRVEATAEVCNKARAIKERHGCCRFDPTLLAIRDKSDYSVNMFSQSWKYFHEYEAELRRHLRFRGDVEARAREELANRLQVLRKRMADNDLGAPEVFVGIHVRRGNYLDKAKVEFGYKVANASYLAQATEYFRSKFEGVGFFVFSNDIAWCRKNINGSDVEFIPGGPPEQDLATLSLMNHTIMTVGTYGWWGSWLAGGQTLYLKDFVTPGSRYAREFPPDTSEFFPKHWLGL